MAVFEALRESPAALRRAPGLVAPMLVLFALQLPSMALQWTAPALAALVSVAYTAITVAVAPFVQGGMVGMADEALDGPTSLRAFVDRGRAHYVTLLAAYALLVVGFAVAGGAVGALAVLGVLLSSAGTGVAPLLVVGLVVAVLALAIAVAAFLIQFYVHAIVLDGCDAVEGLRRSYRVVRANLAAAAGYALLSVVAGGAFGAFFGGLSLLARPRTAALLDLPRLSTGTAVAAGLVAAVAFSLFSALFLVFSVAFYRRIRDRPPADREAAATG